MAQLKQTGSGMTFGSRLESAAAVTGKKGMKVGHFLMGVPVVAGVMTALSVWDHKRTQEKLTNEYRHEIAGILRKKPKEVNIDDMERVAKISPVIGAAVERSKAKRNWSILTTIAGAAVTMGLAFAVAPLLPVGISLFAHLAVEGAIGMIGFVGVEHTLTKVGEERLGLKEGPNLKAVKHNPRLQGRMHVPEQITFLAHQQEQKKAITQEQVMTVLASANPILAAQIESRYGAPFAALPEDRKRAAIVELGEHYQIGRLTDDINSHRMRVQELAFTAYGQASAPSERNATQQKLAFARSEVSGAIPGYEEPQPESTVWRNRIEAQRRQSAPAQGLA